MAKNAEARIQASVVEYVRRVCPDVLIYHTPNGGLRTKSEAALMKYIGVVAGIPDLTILYGEGRAAFWEVKTEKGALSKNQAIVASWLELSGFPWFLIRSIDDARQALADLGIETREATS